LQTQVQLMQALMVILEKILVHASQLKFIKSLLNQLERKMLVQHKHLL